MLIGFVLSMYCASFYVKYWESVKFQCSGKYQIHKRYEVREGKESLDKGNVVGCFCTILW